MMVGVGVLLVFGTLFAQSAEGGSENSMASSIILEFGDRGKRNMLYDARQRPQAVLLNLSRAILPKSGFMTVSSQNPKSARSKRNLMPPMMPPMVPEP